jgi:hypothetical protein
MYLIYNEIPELLQFLPRELWLMIQKQLFTNNLNTICDELRFPKLYNASSHAPYPHSPYHTPYCYFLYVGDHKFKFVWWTLAYFTPSIHFYRLYPTESLTTYLIQ